MLTAVLQVFPAQVYPLTVVSDPDGLLADESTLAALVERGFRIIQESDPLLLRYRVEQARPFTPQAPVLLITPDELEMLPYDVWQQGHRLRLDLHSYFPNLAYPILRTLTPFQRAHLREVPQPSTRLGVQGTVDYLLRHIFDIPAEMMQRPADFITRLDEIHRRGLTPLPEALLSPLLEQIQKIPAYAGWPVREILQSYEAFTDFIQDQWEGYIRQRVHESTTEYALLNPALIPFGSDPFLQDSLSRLVRSGSLTPLQVTQPENLPEWTAPAVRSSGEDPRPMRVDALLADLYDQLPYLPSDARWEAWVSIARAWAELAFTWFSPSFQPSEAQQQQQKRLQSQLDVAFLEWLRHRYTPLGAQRLPTPHHVYQVPYYLAYLRNQATIEKVALLILDGLSLADWMLIGQTWRTRHLDWRFDEQLVLAQIPTITAISRMALASGLRPSDLVTPGSPRDEADGWRAFWVREGLPENAITSVSLALNRSEPPAELSNPRLQAVCLIDRTIDDILHGSVLGTADLQGSLRLWLANDRGGQHTSAVLEALLDELLERGFTVFITSDHGHCEARGMGQPSEGLTAQTRGKRARLYDDRRAALRVQIAFAETILWEKDGLLPENMAALIPDDRKAFTTYGEMVVTHGGLTLDEVVIPLVKIRKSEN